MSKPLLRAEGLICNDDFTRVLVQCDEEESFYRFPGGTIEFGETAAEAIMRELIEEFDLEVEVNTLALINESIIEYDGKQRHDCTLIHWCELKGENDVDNSLLHKEQEGIKLTWKSLIELSMKPVYPEGILKTIEYVDMNRIQHSIIRKKY